MSELEEKFDKAIKEIKSCFVVAQAMAKNSFSVSEENIKLKAENERLKETNQKLHRRVQATESALVEWRKFSNLTEKQSTGRFFPALMRYALDKSEEENERLKAFALKLVESEEELQQLDYWAEEYLHAYDQLSSIRDIAAENERLTKIITNAKIVAAKAKNAKEYYEELVEGRFVEIPPIAKKLVNQSGRDFEQALEGE